MILRNYWYVAARADEIGRAPLARIICNELIVLYRTQAGQAVALRDLCSHRRAPLSKGKLVGDAIECAYHGLVFGAGGRCVKIPSQDDIPAQAHIDAFPAIDRWGLVWLWMGAAQDADSDLIPAKPWRADAAWNADSTHYYHVKASHMLMTDNLLDLGHVAYIHADTIGFNAAALKADPLVTDVEGTTVRNTRILKNLDPAPAVKSWGNFTGKVDRHSISEWTPPCFTSIEFANRNNEATVEFRIDHLITPETDATHHYWVLVSRNFRIDDHDLTKRIHADNDRVAAQDMDIVEAQQRMIELSPNYRDMPIRQDKGLMAAHRILERLYRAERSRAAEAEEARHAAAVSVGD
ncbi:MAG: Rieske 2Fe-2S domain-containing protein [Alphaproteobacteria bacterium]